MKYSLLALLALAISPAPAEENAITENSPFNLQVIYHEKDHDPVEVNTVSTVDYTAMVPIERSETSTWICTVRFNLQPDQTLADISIADPKLSRIDEKAITYPTQLFQATVPFKNGAAIQVLKTSRFTIQMTITLQPDPAAAEKPEPPPIFELTAAETKQLQVSFKLDDRSQLTLTGYNPTKHRLSEFQIRVVIPKAEGSEAVDRLYNMGIATGGLPLDDFLSQKSLNVVIPKGVTPVFTIEKVTGDP